MQGQFANPAPLGLIPSHEIAGTIAKLGPSYLGSLKVGDRVGMLNFKNACGACVNCDLRATRGKELDPRFCENRVTAGFQHDGGFADYAAADPETTIKLSDGTSFEQAAPLMCAGATVWGSLEKATAGLDKGETVAIIGIGGLGHLGVQFAKALGFKVVAIDSRLAGRQLAKETDNIQLHPELVVDSSDPEAATREIFDFTQGEGVAATIVCTDSIAANTWALGLLRIGGVLGLLGLPPKPWQFDPELMVFRELTIKGSYVAGKEAAERMMEVVDKFGVKSHLTSIGFDEIPNIVSMYEDKAFKGRLVVRLGED